MATLLLLEIFTCPLVRKDVHALFDKGGFILLPEGDVLEKYMEVENPILMEMCVIQYYFRNCLNSPQPAHEQRSLQVYTHRVENNGWVPTPPLAIPCTAWREPGSRQLLLPLCRLSCLGISCPSVLYYLPRWSALGTWKTQALAMIFASVSIGFITYTEGGRC
jgi:hypothetical protein